MLQQDSQHDDRCHLQRSSKNDALLPVQCPALAFTRLFWSAPRARLVPEQRALRINSSDAYAEVCASAYPCETVRGRFADRCRKGLSSRNTRSFRGASCAPARRGASLLTLAADMTPRRYRSRRRGATRRWYRREDAARNHRLGSAASVVIGSQSTLSYQRCSSMHLARRVAASLRSP